ncbi:MAG: HAD family hydrolase [Rhodospirillales bacterium]|nr:HAD family hydrolase [Rhodospirillales bacterium]
MTPPIKAVTFDLWDTIVDDDSDEAKRQAQGLRSKPAERRHLLWEALNRHESISEEQVNAAFDTADAAFNHTWKKYFITLPVADRLTMALKELGRSLPGDELAALAVALGRMEVDIPPDPIDGIEAALKELSGRYKLCIVSDAIVTPGYGLREILEGHGLKQYFQAFAFSDEVGYSKPHPSMFQAAAEQLGVEKEEMVHVGDRDHNDVKGPQALGIKAVLFTATRDDDKAMTSADAICERPADLPGIIDGLAE